MNYEQYCYLKRSPVHAKPLWYPMDEWIESEMGIERHEQPCRSTLSELYEDERDWFMHHASELEESPAYALECVQAARKYAHMRFQKARDEIKLARTKDEERIIRLRMIDAAADSHEAWAEYCRMKYGSFDDYCVVRPDGTMYSIDDEMNIVFMLKDEHKSFL